jgi:hypothetical protein
VQSERRRSIIVWGPPGSGKSVYLSSLVLWLTREQERPPLAVLPADSRSATWLARRTRVAGSSIILDRSAPDEDLYRFRIYERRDAGEAAAPRSRLLAELTPGSASEGDPTRALLESACGVMLFLPVPAMSRASDARAAHVAWLTATLAGLPATIGAAPPAVRLPVAVCLTQTDAIPDAARRDARQWLESFGVETTSALRAHCARHEVFKLSALGHGTRHHDGVESIPVTPEPRGVLAPIRWILSQTEVAA